MVALAIMKLRMGKFVASVHRVKASAMGWDEMLGAVLVGGQRGLADLVIARVVVVLAIVVVLAVALPVTDVLVGVVLFVGVLVVILVVVLVVILIG